MAAFCNDFSRILQLLWNNQQFLFNRGMQEQLRGRESGSFICENDPRDIRVYASFLVNYLYSTNWVTYDDRFALQTALMELLTNALEHGNCNISFTEKTACFFPARKWSTSSWKRTRIQKLLQSESIFPTLSPTKSHISRLRMRERALTSTTRCPARRMNPSSIPIPFQASWKPLKWFILPTSRLCAAKMSPVRPVLYCVWSLCGICRKKTGVSAYPKRYVHWRNGIPAKRPTERHHFGCWKRQAFANS